MQYGPFDETTISGMALAIILSAIVSLVGTMSRERDVKEGKITSLELSELSGIMTIKELQDAFGPPNMHRQWSTVSLEDIRAARRPMGWLMSSDSVDWACVGVAVMSLFINHVIVSGAVVIALGVQIAGWVVSTRLPR